MNQSNESALASEALGIRIRWAVLAAAGIMVFDQIGAPVFEVALGVMAMANLALLKLVAKKEWFAKFGRKAGWIARIADGAILTGIGFLPPFGAEKLWLLTVPVLVGEALISRNKRNVALTAAPMALIQAGVLFANHASPTAIAMSVGTIFAGAAVGLVLSGYRVREEHLVTHDRRLSSVLDCGAALAASRDLRATILHTLKSAVHETGATCGYVMLIDESGSATRLVTEVAYSVEGKFTFPEELEVGQGMSGFVAKMGQPVAITDGGEENQFDGVTAGVHSAASVPLVTRSYSSTAQSGAENVLGVLSLLSLDGRAAFSADDMDLLRALGSLISVTVSNSRMEERQRTTFLRTMQSLATALEARDEYTRGHSHRVSEVSLMIGEKLGFGAEALEELRVGTILHDIGKIGVPDEILNKRGRLTDEEFEVMKSHPVKGYEICRPLMLSEGILMIIRNHHEKLDGSGYPDGLKGGELPLSLRIVCVADAFDAMSSKRPYRGVMETSMVLAELSKGAGTQFDPVVVETLKELMDSPPMQELYAMYWDDRARAESRQTQEQKAA